MVRITVESPTGVLAENNETVTVKVPSNRLMLNLPYSVEENRSVSFVFDLTVVEAGGSGKYVLTPVIGQSGTSVPVKPTKVNGKPATAGPPTTNGTVPVNGGNGSGPPGRNGSADADLKADVIGPVQANDSATVRVTAGNRPVDGATVSIDGTDVGETDDRGRFTFTVPDSETVTVRVESMNRSVELELEVTTGSGEGNGNASGGNSSDDSENSPPANAGKGNGNGNDS